MEPLNWEFSTLIIRPLRIPLRPDDVLPELSSIKETSSKNLSKVVHVIQTDGSMEAEKNLQLFSL